MKNCQNCIHKLACDDADAKDCAFFADKDNYQKVVHAKWEFYSSIDMSIYCSNCLEKNKKRTKFCPNCGAKMIGVE